MLEEECLSVLGFELGQGLVDLVPRRVGGRWMRYPDVRPIVDRPGQATPPKTTGRQCPAAIEQDSVQIGTEPVGGGAAETTKRPDERILNGFLGVFFGSEKMGREPERPRAISGHQDIERVDFALANAGNSFSVRWGHRTNDPVEA